MGLGSGLGTLWRCLVKVASLLTVEPSCFFYYFAYGIYATGATRLVVQKTCFPDAQPDIDLNCNVSSLMKEASDYNTIRSVLREALPPFVMFLAGAWRDWTGLTYPLLALSISGVALAVCVSLISSIFWQISPLVTALLEALFAGAGGGWQLLHLSTYCYLSNRTSIKERTTRFTWLMVAMTSGNLIGNYISGHILTGLGYIWFFSAVLCCKMIAIGLGYIFMKEKRQPPPEGEKFFKLDKFLVPFNRKGYCVVNWIMILNSWFLYCGSVAEGSSRLLFAEKQFGINVTDFSYYMAYCIAIHFIGLLIYPPLLIRLFKWSDFTITIVSLVIYTISYTGIGFSTTVVEWYIFSTFNPMKNSLIVLHRSILTKCVDDNELGMYCSFIGMGEGFIPLAFLYLYNYVFKETMDYWPGAYHLITTALGLVMLTNVCFATYMYKRQCCKGGKCNEGCKCIKDREDPSHTEDPIVKK